MIIFAHSILFDVFRNCATLSLRIVDSCFAIL